MMENETKEEEDMMMKTSSSLPPPPQGMMVVQTIDDFKTNCSLLESALVSDLQDPTPDLAKLMTWFGWIDGNNGSRDHVVHFYG